MVEVCEGAPVAVSGWVLTDGGTWVTHVHVPCNVHYQRKKERKGEKQKEREKRTLKCMHRGATKCGTSFFCFFLWVGSSAPWMHVTCVLRETCVGPCVVAGAYAAAINQASYTALLHWHEVADLHMRQEGAWGRPGLFFLVLRLGGCTRGLCRSLRSRGSL